eukprot:EC715990.1.p1 GENE.EC715990.1~~EC715990.1.p1  ORF type:complete len:70 (+),score=9.27 EC715990.1:66-275(+)
MADQRAFQKDWDRREFAENIRLSTLKIAHFLNQFDSTVRKKLATLNERIERLDRHVEHLEAALAPEDQT